MAVSQSLIRGIVSTQLQSLIWSLLGIFAVTALFGGSWRWGFYCLLPSLLAVVIKFAVMGWADIPLGVATSMFAAMTLGIGVNCTIHLLEGFSQARAAGKSPADALSQSLRLTGPPALINTLAVSLGFGVLMLSQVPANARLGLLLVLGLVNCFVASLLLLPVLLHWWPLKDSGRSQNRCAHKLICPKKKTGPKPGLLLNRGGARLISQPEIHRASSQLVGVGTVVTGPFTSVKGTRRLVVLWSVKLFCHCTTTLVPIWLAKMEPGIAGGRLGSRRMERFAGIQVPPSSRLISRNTSKKLLTR